MNYVKAREFRQLFGFREVLGMPSINGHLTGYWNTGYYYYNSKVSLGKYLAGDKGATLTVSRDFPNGWKVGGFLTLTDAPFAAFGEGSFDKGIFLRLPINSLVPYETNSFVEERIRPIQGDGGQQIILPIRLYDLIKDKNKRDLDNSWSKIWR